MIDRKKRKKFGQNYLIDPVTIHKIIKSIGLDHQLPYLEIGPGHGAITDSFIGAINNYSAVEIDHENIEFLLKKYGDQQINLISQDILSFNFESLPENVKIIGNLPYNIASQIIIKILTSKVNPKDLHFMVQKEFADRLCAKPGDKSWSKISIKSQVLFFNESLFEIDPIAFDIKPKVTSSFIRMTPLKNPIVKKADFHSFSKFIDVCFQSKRKSLKNNLKDLLIDADFSLEHFKKRPEEITLDQYKELFKMIK